MKQSDIQNLILLGVGGFAVYYLFFRKAPVLVPFPTAVSVTPQIVGSGINNQAAQLVGGTWLPGAGGFPATPDDSGSATQYDYVLVE